MASEGTVWDSDGISDVESDSESSDGFQRMAMFAVSAKCKNDW